LFNGGLAVWLARRITRPLAVFAISEAFVLRMLRVPSFAGSRPI